MNERHVRSSGRQTYGRAMPLNRPRRSAKRLPTMGLLQRRLLLLVILLAAVGFGLLRLFAINTITVHSNGRTGEIKTESQKLVDASWAQGNLLTFDDDDFVSKLQQADPILRQVTVGRHWFHAITVTATLKQPSLGWSTGDQRYLLDKDGTVIGALPAGSPLAVVKDGSNLPVTVGQRVASSRFVAFVGTLVPALAASGFTATSLDVKDTTLDLSVTTNKGYRLIFDTSREVNDEMADLKSVQTLLTAQKKAPAEYIDLRITGKAYYK